MAYRDPKLHIVAVGAKQKQADWLEQDPNDPAYIKNKPNITGGLHYEVVEELPTEDIDPNCIYMVPREGDTEAGNYYDEYMYIEGDWEMIGSTSTQNIQSDWSESDPTYPSYINNKPDTLDFIVPFTEVSDVISTTVSKADIIAAMNAGKTVRATLNGQFYELVAYTASPEKMSFSTVIEDTTVSIIGKIVNDNWVWGSYETELNVQANWNEADASSPAYIQNKPTLATVATSGDYTDLDNTPTIPTVNDATITIQQGGVTVGTFTTNDDNNTTIDLAEAPKSWYGTYNEFVALEIAGQLRDDTNYFINGELARVATTGSYTDLTNRPNLATVATTGEYSDLKGALTPKENVVVGSKQTDWYGTKTEFDALEQAGLLDWYKNYYIEDESVPQNEWYGTQQEFDALQDYDLNTDYYIQGDLATVATTGSFNDLNDVPTNMVFGNAQGTPTSFTIRTISAADYANLPSYDSNTVYLVY